MVRRDDDQVWEESVEITDLRENTFMKEWTGLGMKQKVRQCSKDDMK